MSEKKSGITVEKSAKWYRNFNLIGAAVFAGAGVYLAPISPEAAVVSFTIAGIDAIQALGGELVRQWRANASGNKKTSNANQKTSSKLSLSPA